TAWRVRPLAGGSGLSENRPTESAQALEAHAMIATGARRLFDAYVFVDWSARNVPSPARPCADTIWIGEYAPGDGAPRETYCPTRQGATDHVFRALSRHVAAGRRVLVGFDFPYGYPAGLAAALGLAGPEPAWLRTWR